MTFKKPDMGYWNRKFSAYMHDPFNKVFSIREHEDIATDLQAIYGVTKPNEKTWQKADGIASGFERGQVPSHSADKNKNGSIDFLKNPVITHPISEDSKLDLDFDGLSLSSKEINLSLKEFLRTEIGVETGQSGFSDQYKSDEENFAVARFLYTHLALRFKLAEENVGKIGGLWHRIPADSRFPDHSIWQHNALTSAIYSCLELSQEDGSEDIGMMVMSITPVQAFISKARKLRDYWTGSVILSWLAFEGLRWVIENLGPDHILYPSLIDQSLVLEYLKKSWRVNKITSLNKESEIASFPNKFLFLIPPKQAPAIAKEISNHINSVWRNFYLNVFDKVSNLTADDSENIKKLFQRQNEDFWDIQWSAVKMVQENDKVEINKLLPSTASHNQLQVLAIFKNILKNYNQKYSIDGRGLLYSVSHSICQAALAAQKNKKQVTRKPENGEKCHLCGEFEVVHNGKTDANTSAADYKGGIDQFWKTDIKQWQNKQDFKEHEKLCSICLTKRIAYSVLKKDEKHLLNSCFKSSEGFPSTTYMAMYNKFNRDKIKDEKKKREIAQKLHDQTEVNSDNRDHYYAILFMDGDKMGKLVNGETLASTWKSILHPEMLKRLQNSEFDKNYRENWGKIFDEYKSRLLTPSIHAAISEALGDFAIYGVAEIVKRYCGKLIYAGGDDVCAVLPVDTVMEAAREIRDYYISSFRHIDNTGGSKELMSKWPVQGGKLSINLGKGKRISISAGILICHHKESLSEMIKSAESLLKTQAKDLADRDACSIELKKRSGGSRIFTDKWNSESWKAFLEIGQNVNNKDMKQVSKSLIYRLEQFRVGVEAILKNEDHEKLIVRFITKQLKRSFNENEIQDKKELEEFGEQIKKVVIIKNGDKFEFKPEGLIISAFIADKGGS